MVNVEREYPQFYLVQLLLRITYAEVYSLEALNKVYKKLFPQNTEIIKTFDIVAQDVGIKYPEKVKELTTMLKKAHNQEDYVLTL